MIGLFFHSGWHLRRPEELRCPSFAHGPVRFLLPLPLRLEGVGDVRPDERGRPQRREESEGEMGAHGLAGIMIIIEETWEWGLTYRKSYRFDEVCRYTNPAGQRKNVRYGRFRKA